MIEMTMVRMISHEFACFVVRHGGGGSATGRRRDKRGSPDESQAIDMAWLPPGASVGSRAARARMTRQFKHHSGTHAFQTLQWLHR